MLTGTCAYCNKTMEMKSLKKCGACGGVMYCSRECQKLSWKLTHKYTCVPIAVLPEKEEVLKYYARIISGWQNVWKGHLDGFALMALDLANNPGKNATHCMWLEFTYTGHKDDREKFEIYRGCIRTAEEVLAECPHLQIMRDPPPLIGKRIRYAMVFHFEEEDKPTRSFVRARSWELPKSLEPWKDRPAGWEAVYEVIQAIFGGIDEEDEEIIVVVPVDALVA
ncbi:hypothetical protein BDM02DRAFT_3124476 [Thelephora ganbajun]|uniref:Uncharacterized protein n=1 Tax=Thelephora ganbajun TaxID=370292 RepID=A0ACB6YZ01_THEGA|nr:hypothetical protein BDM02DRAFT_3124476 [Thelephora ganbajun]